VVFDSEKRKEGLLSRKVKYSVKIEKVYGSPKARRSYWDENNINCGKPKTVVWCARRYAGGREGKFKNEGNFALRRGYSVQRGSLISHDATEEKKGWEDG